MLVDGFTVVAQLVNFLILVGLLKHFLYRPILDAMARREQRIADELAAAARSQEAAAHEQAAWEEKNRGFEQAKEALFRQAEADAAKRRQALVERADAEVRQLEERWRSSLEARQSSFERELASRAQQQALATARDVLAAMAGVSLDVRMAEVFLERLRALSGAEQEQLRSALMGACRIVSAHSLPEATRQALSRAVAELGGPAPVFETNEALVSGIQLIAGPLMLGWGVGDYLDQLSERIVRSLQEVIHASRGG